jgi:histidinol-phosphatase (PHP family)
MNISTIHTHTHYSDGVGDAYKFVENAIDLGLDIIGFSDHTPVPLANDWSMKIEDLPKYIDEINYIKKVYKKHIKVYLGLELDYIEGLDVMKYIDIGALGLDYFIGSVHYVYSEEINGYRTVDHTREISEAFIKEGFHNDSVAFYTKYYETERAMIKAYEPVMIAHINLPEKFNRDGGLFNTGDEAYRKQVDSTLDIIRGSAVEVNTGALARNIDVLYPSDYILKDVKKRGIPVSLNSDCHIADRLQFSYIPVCAHLKDMGFTEAVQFDGKKMKPYKL